MCIKINEKYTDYCAEHVLEVLEDAEKNYAYAQWSLDFENRKVARLLTGMSNSSPQAYSNRKHLTKLEDMADDLREIGILVADRVNALNLAVWKYDRTAEGVAKNLRASKEFTLHSEYRNTAREAYEAGKWYRDRMMAVKNA